MLNSPPTEGEFAPVPERIILPLGGVPAKPGREVLFQPFVIMNVSETLPRPAGPLPHGGRICTRSRTYNSPLGGSTGEAGEGGS